YKVLLEEGKVSPPVLAEGNLGTTGTGQDMRVNDRAIRITQDPTLQVSPRDWSASVTTKDGDGEAKGADKPAAPAVAPRPAPAHKAAPKKAPPKPQPKPKPVDEPAPASNGRF